MLVPVNLNLKDTDTANKYFDTRSSIFGTCGYIKAVVKIGSGEWDKKYKSRQNTGNGVLDNEAQHNPSTSTPPKGFKADKTYTFLIHWNCEGAIRFFVDPPLKEAPNRTDREKDKKQVIPARPAPPGGIDSLTK
jgi:hypothetical protein